MTILWTIGHSTRDTDQFVASLAGHGVRRLVDVRRFPTSKRHPHFRVDALRRTLHAAGIRYEYLGDELGGMRDRRPGSRHVGLHDSSFQAYADWMETPEFRRGVHRLLALCNDGPTAVMCAEGNPKSCHRRLLSDHVALVHGVEVLHIRDAATARPHEPTPGVHRADDGLVYLSPESSRPIDSYDGP